MDGQFYNCGKQMSCEYVEKEDPKKPKVLFIHNSVAEYRVKFWEILGTNLDVQLLITNSGLDEKIYGLKKDTGKLKIEYMKFRNLAFNPLYNPSNYDVVILPPADMPKEFIVGLWYALMCKLKRIKLVYWTEHWEASRKDCSLIRYLYNLSERVIISILGKLSDRCIASGEQAEGFYRRIGIESGKIQTVIDSSTSPSVKEDVDFYGEYGISDNEKVILYFGRLVERKGVMHLLKAFSMIQAESRQNYWLLICGDGPMLENCKEFVAKQGLKRVVFAGKIQPNIRKRYYERADVFTLPSYPRNGSVEAWGLTVNEALECGTPVVATDAVGAAYDLLDGRNGVMIRHSSVSELKDALMKYSDKTIYTKHCLEIAESTSVEMMAAGFERVLRDAVDSH